MTKFNPAYFLDFFPEFKNVPPQTLSNYVDVVHLRVPFAVWSRNAPSIEDGEIRVRYARSLLMAHMLTIRGFGGDGSGGGAITQETVGDLSRSYGTVGEAASGDAELRTTRYGIMFVELRNEFIVGVMPAGPSRPRPFPGC